MTHTSKLVIYTDGGSRGNPGPAALGVVIKDASGTTIKKYGEALGKKTNNEAEYEAVIFALKKIKQIFGGKTIKTMPIEIRTDSQLVAFQLSGEYKIEEEKLYPLFIKIWNLKMDVGPVRFVHIPREKNREADALVNEALDAHKQTSFLS